MKIIKIILGLWLISMSLLGEENTSKYIPENAVKAPESAQLCKYLSFPVNKALGLVNISIPLFNIPTPTQPISFSLSYHASGIKVNDPVGTIGYGWSLMPIPRIIREHRGKVDEFCKVRNPATIEISPNNLNLLDSVAFWVSPEEYDLSNVWGYDGEHDIYTLNLNGENISFVVDILSRYNYKAVKINDTPCRIEVVAGISSNMIAGFIIQDDKGVIYKFGNLDGELDYFTGDGASNTSGNYLLKNIIYPNNEEISFSYTKLISPIMPGQDKYMWVLDFNTFSVIDIGTTDQTKIIYNTIYDEKDISPKSFLFDYLLSEITFPQGNVTFSYGDYNLKNIVIKNNNAEIIKTININKENYLLKSIDISDVGKYTFMYNTKKFDNPYAQDRFGYYNGIYSNNYNSLFPKFEYRKFEGFTGDSHLATDSIYIQANMLTAIAYPTGGKAILEYEVNKGLYLSNEVVKAGLRIKKVKQYDPVTQDTITTSYKYGVNESGYGIAQYNFANEKYYKEKKVKFYYNEIVLNLKKGYISPYNKDRELSNGAPIIWYDEITEYFGENKIVEKFDYIPDVGEIHTEIKRYIEPEPRISHQKIYKGDKLIQESEWKYWYMKQNITHQNSIDGFYAISNSFFFPLPQDVNYGEYQHVPLYGNANENSFATKHTIPKTVGVNCGSAFEYDFTIFSYKIYTGLNQVRSKQTKYYEESEVPLITNEYFYYDDDRFYNLVEKVTENSLGEKISEVYKYAYNDYPNYPDSIKTALVNNNYITSPIVREKYKTVNEVESLLQSEKILYNTIAPKLLKPTEVAIKNKKMSNFETENIYTYYPDGQVKTLKGRDNILTIYIWGYNRKYVVAEIKNATPQQVTSLTGDLYALGENTPNMSTLNALRTQLPNALIKTYEYKPLVGVTSITDERGEKIFYEYNDKNQLKEIYRMENGTKQILESYSYKYATE